MLDRDGSESAGYLSLLFALRHGTDKQADLAPLAGLTEPYARPDADDAGFYALPRRVDHLDAAARSVWRAFTGRFVQDGMAVLDLMASCDSHLPDEARPAAVAGLGMNAAELSGNPQLTERIVHDLNAAPALPFAEAHFDVVLCALSIEYLERPEAVLRDVRRTLKPGGACVLTFSERWFPPKAVLPWPTLPPFSRVAWVLRHLQRAGFADLHTESLRGLPRPADDKYYRQTQTADPLYAVWGCA
ncbi:MAG: methyltransferase domain-containing protein [Rhodocyclaceae bacterium]|nr:methyltransferase domain-containing protein [Rhodocyclaceae bacterium]